MPSAKWANKTLVVDGTNGNDEASGDSAHPIRTTAEQTRRQGSTVSIGATRILASARGLVPGVADAGAILQSIINEVRASGKSQEIWIDGYTYNQTTPIVDNLGQTSSAPTVKLVGIAKTGTRLRASGAMLTAGDQLTLDKSFNFEMHNMCFGATSARAAGCRAVVVKGGIAAPVKAVLQHILWTHINWENQFDGFTFLDSAGSGINNGIGTIGFEWYYGTGKFTAAGGNGIDIASQNSEIVRFENITMDEDQSSVVANSFVRLRALADVRFRGCEAFGVQTSLRIEPGAFMSVGSNWFVNTAWFDQCIWSGPVQAVLVDVTGSAGTCGLLKFTGNYADSQSAGPGVVINGSGNKLQNLISDGWSFQSVGGDAIKINGGTGNVSFKNTGIAGTIGGAGFHATGSAKNFDFHGVFSNFGGTGCPTGAQVDTGCDNWSLHLVGAKTFCTTPLINPDGTSATRVVVANV